MCLPKKEVQRLRRTQHPEQRLRIEVRLARKEYSTLRHRLRFYRPWPEGGGYPYSPGAGDIVGPLNVADCALKLALQELLTWKPRSAEERGSLLILYDEVTDAHRSLQEALVWAPPEIQPQVKKSGELAEDVETEIRCALRTPSP